MHGDKPIHIAHEGREALPGRGGGRPPVGRRIAAPARPPRAPLLPFLLELVPLGGLPVPLLLLLRLLRLARQLRQRGVLIAEDGPEVLHLEAGLRGLSGIGDDGKGPLLPLCAEQCFSLLESPSRWGAAWAAPRAPARKWLTRVPGATGQRGDGSAPGLLGVESGASPKLGGSALAGCRASGKLGVVSGYSCGFPAKASPSKELLNKALSRRPLVCTRLSLWLPRCGPQGVRARHPVPGVPDRPSRAACWLPGRAHG